MVVYGIPNCSTVKKACQWLDAHGITYTFHDYKKKGISSEKLADWMTIHSWEKLINRAGTTYRKLPDEVKAAIQSKEAAQAAMIQQPSMIKRPIIEWQGQVIVGFDETVYTTFVN
ncbi:MAG: ArsC family reductase [Spirosomataceae bacterium]